MNGRKVWLTGKGEWMLPKGQCSWNIAVTKEARMDPKVVLEFRWNTLIGEYFLSIKKSSKQQTYFKIILQALSLVTNQAEP